MPDYIKGTVLGTLTTLPVMGAASFFLLKQVNMWLVAAFLLVNIISLSLTATAICRYAVNRQRYQV